MIHPRRSLALLALALVTLAGSHAAAAPARAGHPPERSGAAAGPGGARSADAEEARAVRESFASSVLWGAEVAAEAPDGRLLVDFTPFLVRDAHGVAARLKAAGQGGFALDRERSALAPDDCPAFPDNLEFEAVLTFAGDQPGPEVRATAPT